MWEKLIFKSKIFIYANVCWHGINTKQRKTNYEVFEHDVLRTFSLKPEMFESAQNPKNEFESSAGVRNQYKKDDVQNRDL